MFGPQEVDLFASRLTSQLPIFCSWRPDPLARATDALIQDWTAIKGFANPPWVLVGRVLAQVRAQRAQIILVAPVWKAQPWYADLLHMLVDHPHLIHHTPLISKQVNVVPQEPLPQLAIWHISGRDTPVNNYQEATDLMLKSWRTKTNRSYDSLRYRSLNAYRSAISSTHEKLDGVCVGEHPLVSRVLKGAFNSSYLAQIFYHLEGVYCAGLYCKIGR